MPECAKTHLQQSRISKFSGGRPPDPLFKGRGGKGKGGEEGKDREGRGGTARDREGRTEGGEEWGVGRGEEGRALDMGSAPLETSFGSAPELTCKSVFASWSILRRNLTRKRLRPMARS